jgi:hypothetical protein
MFPNPQAALPLPPRPNLESYRQLANELVEAHGSGDARVLAAFADRWIASLSLVGRAADRAAGQVEAFARRHLAGGCSLAEAQVVLARSHGFATWAVFAVHVERLARGTDRFEAAVDAVIAGDQPALQALLAASPGLVREKSDREHGGTLLVYTSANGVESYRQRTPANIVSIAESLLDAGADVDATADVYGGACTTLGLVATSTHPRRAGVQLPLIQLLLDRGARLEDGVVHSCLGNGCPEAAAYLADRGAPIRLVEAAGLGRLEVAERLLNEASTAGAQVDEALRYACAYGRTTTVELLLRRGADPATTTGDGQTAAHVAVIGGQLQALKVVLERRPSLEQTNVYGGTVLGQALWSAAHSDNPERYVAIIEVLLAAGAALPARHVPVNPQIDAFLAAKGSLPEPTWFWFGEEPRS